MAGDAALSVIEGFAEFGVEVRNLLGRRCFFGRQRTEVVHHRLDVGRLLIGQDVGHRSAAAMAGGVGDKRPQPIRVGPCSHRRQVWAATHRQAGVAAVAVDAAEFVVEQATAGGVGRGGVKALESYNPRFGPQAHDAEERGEAEAKVAYHPTPSRRQRSM